MSDEDEFRPIPGYEGLYELDRSGHLWAVERILLQQDSVGRCFQKTIPRHLKFTTINGNGYVAYNVHKNGKQTIRCLGKLMRDVWGEEWPPKQLPHPLPSPPSEERK